MEGEVTKRDLRLAGLLATAVCLGVLWVVAAFFPREVPFPPSSLADGLIRLTPGDISTFFIDLLKGWAIRLLAVGVMVGTLAFGAYALVWARPLDDRPSRYRLAGLGLALVAAVSIVLGPADDEEPLFLVIVLGATALLYAWTARRFASALSAGEDGFDPSRRRAIRTGIGGAVGIAAGGGAIGWVVKRLGGPDTNVPLVAPEVRATIPDRGTFPDIPGLAPEITSVTDHYVVDINFVQPSVDAGDWSLRVHGLVDRPTTLTFQSLQERFPVVEEYSLLTCISNEVGGDLVGNSLWGGVRLHDVLDEAGVKDGAVDVVLRAADRYSDSIPIDIAMDPSVMLAVAHNREPLRREHGFPCRLRVPMIYGMKNVKWITEIEVVDSDYKGYWMQRGWSDEATIHTSSRIDVAGTDRSAVVGEDAWIAGVAWAGGRGIDRVEVSVDGGDTWSDAMLKDPISPYSWTLWAYRWTPSRRGPVTVVCRATDGAGRVQTDEIASPHPAGATGYHRIDVAVE